MSVLERYHESERVELPQGVMFIKPGMRGYPELPPAMRVFRNAFLGGGTLPLVDASGTAGAVALMAQAAFGAGENDQPVGLTVLEPSMAALRCARRTFHKGAEVRAALPWDLAPGSISRLALAPPADRGNARVIAELQAAAEALREDGTLHVALHKDQGGKRYLKKLTELFGGTKVVARERGWRLIEARLPLASQHVDPWLGFEGAGMELVSLPGVHSAGRLDPGTTVLVSAAPWERLTQRRVLDLGCGVGVLALLAAGNGAKVTAVDDDLAAVASTRRNAERRRLRVDVRHSDVDSTLGEEEFDFILTNPPFHVGRGVRLEVPAAFIAAAGRLLRPGGELWLVANRDLPYEREFTCWASLEQVGDEGGFKVLRAVR
ncbi:MAG: methyltransferase [Trueperaceae bacterium]